MPDLQVQSHSGSGTMTPGWGLRPGVLSRPLLAEPGLEGHNALPSVCSDFWHARKAACMLAEQKGSHKMFGMALI